jgi:hypothetical protein
MQLGLFTLRLHLPLNIPRNSQYVYIASSCSPAPTVNDIRLAGDDSSDGDAV